MRTVNIHEAKTHLSRLVAETEAGDSVVIARAGTPVAKLVPVSTGAARPSRIGFLRSTVPVPEDFDRMYEDEIRAAFEGEA